MWMSTGLSSRPAVVFDDDDFLSLPAGFADFSLGVSIFAVAVTDTSPSGSTSRAPRIGVTVIAAGAGGGVLTTTPGALALTAGQRASDALTIVPSAPMTTSATVNAITRAWRSKFKDLSHVEQGDPVSYRTSPVILSTYGHSRLG